MVGEILSEMTCELKLEHFPHGKIWGRTLQKGSYRVKSPHSVEELEVFKEMWGSRYCEDWVEYEGRGLSESLEVLLWLLGSQQR